MLNNLFLVIATLFYCALAILKANPLKARLARKKIILQLSKPIFDDDMVEIKKEMPDIFFIKFPRLYLSRVIRLAVADFTKLSDRSYWTVLSDKESKEISFYIGLFFAVYRFFVPFSAVVSGNYTYVSQQHFAMCCMQKNIPFIVVYKEGTLLKFRSKEYISDIFKDKLVIASHLLLPNEAVKQSFENHAEIFCKNIQMHLVGIPRLQKANTVTKTGVGIVFFFYDPDQKGNFLDNESHSLERELRKILEALASLANNEKITIKCKNLLEKKTLTNYAKLWGIDLSNFTVSHSGTAQNYVRQSKAIISILSTTLIEARILGKVALTLYGLNANADNFLKKIEVYPLEEITNYQKLSQSQKSVSFDKLNDISHYDDYMSASATCANIIRKAI